MFVKVKVLAKGRGFAEGTVRTWNGVRYQKRGKKWRKLQGTGGKPGSSQAEASGGAPQPVEVSLNTTTAGLENPKVKCRIPEGTTVTVKGVEGTVGKYLEKRDRYLFQAAGTKGKLYDLVDPKDIAIAPLLNEKQVLQEIKKATPENRTEINNVITGKEATPDDDLPVEDEFTEGMFLEYAKNVTVSSPIGNPVKAIDVSGIPQKFIKNVSQKDIEAGKKPGYILDFASMHYHLYEVPFVMLDENRCLVKAPKEIKRGMYGSALYGPVGEDTHYVCTLGQLAASVDYYLRRDKAEYKKAWSEAYDASLAKMMEIKTGAKDVDPHSIDSYYKNMSDKDIQSLAKKTANRKTKYLKPSVTGKNRWSYDFSGFIGEMYGMESSFDRESRNKRVQIALQNKKLLEQKMVDLDIDAEEWEGSYQKGYETSFGEKNTRNDLLGTYGVKIKRQNGKEMSPKDIDSVRTVMQLAQQIYGDKTEMNKAANLKVSYTGDTGVFARKAIGLYNPNTMTIVYGNAESGFAFAHEFAHYLDNMLGKRMGNTWSTDDWASEEGQIANKFRDMMVVGSGNSKYWTRTLECFARAMEQYAGSDRAGKDWYMEPERFEKEMKPLIEKWLDRIRPMLKSIKLVFGGSEESGKRGRRKLLVKAFGGTHKYVKRTGSPGHYQYWYKDPQSGKLRVGPAPEAAGGGDDPSHGLDTKAYGWIKRVAKVLRTTIPQHGQMKREDVLVLKRKLDEGIKRGWKLSSGVDLATWSQHLGAVAQRMTKSVRLTLRMRLRRLLKAGPHKYVKRIGTKGHYRYVYKVSGKRGQQTPAGSGAEGGYADSAEFRTRSGVYDAARNRGKTHAQAAAEADAAWERESPEAGLPKKSPAGSERMLDKATLVHQFLIQRQVGNVKKAREHLNDLKRLVPNEKELTALVLKYGDPDKEGFATVRDRWAKEIEGRTRGAVEKQREIVAGAMEVVKELDATEVKTGGEEKSAAQTAQLPDVERTLAGLKRGDLRIEAVENTLKHAKKNEGDPRLISALEDVVSRWRASPEAGLPKKGQTVYMTMNPHDNGEFKKYPVKVLVAFKYKDYDFVVVRNPVDRSLSVTEVRSGLAAYKPKGKVTREGGYKPGKITVEEAVKQSLELFSRVREDNFASSIERGIAKYGDAPVGDYEEERAEIEAAKNREREEARALKQTITDYNAMVQLVREGKDVKRGDIEQTRALIMKKVEGMGSGDRRDTLAMLDKLPEEEKPSRADFVNYHYEVPEALEDEARAYADARHNPITDPLLERNKREGILAPGTPEIIKRNTEAWTKLYDDYLYKHFAELKERRPDFKALDRHMSSMGS